MSKYEALFHEQLEDIKLIFDKIAIFVGLNIKFILIFVLPIIVGLVILTAQTNSSKGTSPFFDLILKNSIISDIIKDTQATYSNQDLLKVGGVRRLFVTFLLSTPIIAIYFYYLNAKYPIINFSGNTGYGTIFLTFLTYIFNRLAILWGLTGFIAILSRYILFWFGLSGGFWTPFVIGSGWFYQPWVRLLPYCIGGVVDFGPIIGMPVHRQASVFFRSTLWCPLPPGILNYDEPNNTFSIDYKFLDMFYQTFFRIIPKSFSQTKTLSYVYLPLPDNYPVFGGYLLPLDNNSSGESGLRSYDLISKLSTTSFTPEELNLYFVDIRQ